MIVREHVPLSTLTTFKVGGCARFVLVCETEEDLREARTFVRTHDLAFRVLGGGSNVLARDEGYDGAIILMQILGCTFEQKGNTEHVRVGAGVVWETLVDTVVARELWGIENLAGIPGTVGAAPVQNIGAYGAELQSLFVSCEVYDMETGESSTYDGERCQFGYRDSIFKHNRALIISSVTLALSRTAAARLDYSDLLRLRQEGKDLGTPHAIASAVREVRSHKFPDLAEYGTAGSFFKNPMVSAEVFETLTTRFGAIPSYPMSTGVKIPLAYILDHVLGLRGYKEKNVYLFGNQPLVVVANKEASEKEIDAFANAIAKKVLDATAITIEREVQSL